MSKKEYKEIIDEINSEINVGVGELNETIQNMLDKTESKISDLLKNAKERINKFTDRPILYIMKLNLNNYISKNIGNEKNSLKEDILAEIKQSCQSLSNIYNKKGFKKWLSSLFSSKIYLENIIDMVLDTLTSKIDYILKIISEQTSKYLNESLRSINNNVNSSTLKFNDDQLKKWKELSADYAKTKERIMKLKG